MGCFQVEPPSGEQIMILGVKRWLKETLRRSSYDGTAVGHSNDGISDVVHYSKILIKMGDSRLTKKH